MTTPRSKISPPQTPHGSPRRSAPARQASRTGHSVQRTLASSSPAGVSANQRSGSVRHGRGRRTGAGAGGGAGRRGREPPGRGSPVRRGGGGRSGRLEEDTA